MNSIERNSTTDINDYIANLLQDGRFLKKEYVSFVNNTYSIDDVEGVVSANVLNKVILNARKSKMIRDMLVDILLYSDKRSITDENFSLLMRFNKRIRNNYISSLAHCDLSFYQMYYINQLWSEYESFAWLFDHMCNYDGFTVYDIENLIRESCHVTKHGVESCIKYAAEKYGFTEKIKVAKILCEKLKSE